MAWSAPRTWVTAEVVTASNMNTEVRDNFLETAPAKATSVDQFFVSTAANTIERRITGENTVITQETTASTTYTDLTTTGPAVTVTSGTRLLIILTSFMNVDSAGDQAFMSYAISGATSASASDNEALNYESGAANDLMQASWARLRTGLTAGSNTVTAKYRTTGGTATFRRRYITLIPL